MANTAKKTATKTATKTNTKVVNIKTTAKERKAKAETPTLEALQAPLIETIEDNQIKIEANAKTGLSYWKAIGDAFIAIERNWITAGGSLVWRAKDRTKKPISSADPESFAEYKRRISSLDKRDVSRSIQIAQNWHIVCGMDTADKLDGLGVKSCTDAIEAHLNAKKPKGKQGPATAATSSKKTKDTKAKKADAETDLEIIQSLMVDPKKFGDLIGKLVNSKYTDAQKRDYVNAQAKCIIIAETK